jgi:hypothetical protein
MYDMHANSAWLHDISLLSDLLEMWKLTQLIESVKCFAIPN